MQQRCNGRPSAIRHHGMLRRPSDCASPFRRDLKYLGHRSRAGLSDTSRTTSGHHLVANHNLLDGRRRPVPLQHHGPRDEADLVRPDELVLWTASLVRVLAREDRRAASVRPRQPALGWLPRRALSVRSDGEDAGRALDHHVASVGRRLRNQADVLHLAGRDDLPHRLGPLASFARPPSSKYQPDRPRVGRKELLGAAPYPPVPAESLPLLVGPIAKELLHQRGVDRLLKGGELLDETLGHQLTAYRLFRRPSLRDTDGWA